MKTKGASSSQALLIVRRNIRMTSLLDMLVNHPQRDLCMWTHYVASIPHTACNILLQFAGMRRHFCCCGFRSLDSAAPMHLYRGGFLMVQFIASSGTSASHLKSTDSLQYPRFKVWTLNICWLISLRDENWPPQWRNIVLLLQPLSH